MTNLDKIRRGATSYVTSEIVPIMDTVKGVLVAALAPKVIEANLARFSKVDWLDGTGLVDESGFNVEEIYKLIKASSSGKWPIELFGIRFSESDLDKLYRHIMEA
jgi:hypothetical protein